MPNLKDNRRGKVYVTPPIIEESNETIKAIQHHMRILEQYYMPAENLYVLKGTSEQFREVTQGEMIPTYEARLTKVNDPFRIDIEFVEKK